MLVPARRMPLLALLVMTALSLADPGPAGAGSGPWPLLDLLEPVGNLLAKR